MSLAPVTELLRQRIGLDAESLGPTALPRAVAARMQALGLAVPADYAVRLAGDAREFQLLLDDVAVSETWFFRGGVFPYLARLVAEATPARRGPFRVLSIPCSTGEEPYSLAIALTEAGVPPTAWSIRGVDLSARHVERARRGRYRAFSFREMPPELRQRYFHAVDDGWELDPAIRALVEFREGNLLDPFLFSEEGHFNLIFCRNLLIYLHTDARRQALDALVRVLALDGWVCAGHAEPLDALDPRFTRAGPPEYFLYRRIPAPRPPRPIQAATTPSTIPEKPQPPQAHRNPVEPTPAMPAPPPDLLSRARELADSGRLDEALAACQARLAESGPSADLFGLMGVVRQARHETDEAIRCYERALYLDRGHAESLTHLMLLCRERGDHAQAERLRRRLERAGRGGEA
jgi:chemotaxis protein methyltransferase WspC